MNTTDKKQTAVKNPIVNPINLADHPIEDWKDLHKKVKLITVSASDGARHQFIVARPTLSQMDMIQKYIKDEKPVKYREAMKANCVKAGDTSLIDGDDDIRNAVFEKIVDLYEKLEVEEKEL